MDMIIEAFEQRRISYKSIASVLGVEPSAIYSRFNRCKNKSEKWEILERYLRLRMSIIDYPDSMSALLRAALDKEEFFKKNRNRKRAKGRAKAQDKIIINGKAYPKRKFDGYEMADNPVFGDKATNLVAFRDDPRIYKIVMQSKTHTVMCPINSLCDRLDESFICYTNSTINAKGISKEKINQKIREYVKL